MNLKPFYKVKNKKRLMVFVSVLVIGLVIVTIAQSYAIYKQFVKKDLINTSTKSDADVYIMAIYVDGIKTNNVPVKNAGKDFEKIVCSNGVTGTWNESSWNLTLNNVGVTECTLYFKTPSYLATALLENNIVKTGNPDFTSMSTSSDTGVYTANDEYGTSNYFRGDKAILKNNVIFANMQWKAIRIDGLGNIKLIYNGTCPNNSCVINDDGPSTIIGTGHFNSWNKLVYIHNVTTGKDPGYVATNIANQAVANWYNANLTNFSSYIVDTVYCNDNTNEYYQIDFNSNTLYYARTRAVNGQPILTCPTPSDKYSVSTSIGNGQLTVKAGLITNDEVNMAGLVTSSTSLNTSNYLYNNQDYWTMSPAGISTGSVIESNSVTTSQVSSVGYLGTQSIKTMSGHRPVITISSIRIASGDGSVANPFILKDREY